MKRPPNRQKRLKRIKTELRTLWSLAVRNRDGNACVMCGKTEGLNAHHWLFRRGHSLALAFEVDNGATLCAYPCHLGRLHRDGDGDFVMRFHQMMVDRIGAARIADMQRIAAAPRTVTLEELEEKRDELLALSQQAKRIWP